MKAFQGLFKERLTRVLHFKIQGRIDRKTTEKVREQLFKVKSYNPAVVALSVASHGGSIAQAEIIAQILKAHAHDAAAPIYTFGEDHVGDTGLYLLTIGNKVFCDKMSLLGNVGSYYSALALKDWMKSTGLTASFITAGDKKVRLNPFEDFKKEDIEWMNKLLGKLNQNLVGRIMENRKMAFLDKKLSDKVIKDTLLSGKLYSAQTALNHGLIDHIGNFNSVVHKDFYGTQIIDTAHQNEWGFQSEMMEIKSVSDLEAHLKQKSMEELLSSNRFEKLQQF